MEKIESKDVVVVKQQVTKAYNSAEEIEIKSETDLAPAADFLKKVKTVQRLVTQEEKKQLDPARATVDAIRSFWRPMKDKIDEAEKIVKKKILAFDRVQSEARAKKEAQLSARVEKGTMKFGTAVKKMDDLPTVQTAIETDKGAVTFKIERKVFVENESQIPDEYWMLDMVKIRGAALGNKAKGIEPVEIPGVKVVEEKNLAA